jgi:hypothetical protein
VITWQGNTIRIEDEITGTGRHLLESRLHLHPDCRLQPNGEMITICMDGSIVAHIGHVGDGSIELSEGLYSPEFGRCYTCPVISSVVADVNLPYKSGWIIEIVSEA